MSTDNTAMSSQSTKRAQRPKITLQIPSAHPPPPRVPPTASTSYYAPPSFHGRPPGSPSSNATNPYYNPFVTMYNSKASDFMFKQFAGFKDFTMNTAKSGLSGGEKTAFWLFNKLSQWSKKWFTHIFLFLCLLCFSVMGAAMFVALESPTEDRELKLYDAEMFQVRQNFSRTLHDLSSQNTTLFRNKNEWLGRITQEVRAYEQLYTDCKAKHMVKDKKTWTFFNAMFYAGTVYTTIAPRYFVKKYSELRSTVAAGKDVYRNCDLCGSTGMSADNSEPRRIVRIPTIKADSEAQTSGHLVLLTTKSEASEINMDTSENQQNVSSIRKRRNLSKNRGQATRQREKTPEPGRMGVPHEDTTTSDEEDSKFKPRSSREMEAEDNYKEMMRLVQEKSEIKDPDDIDADEIKEKRAFAEHERRRRSISPFALPNQEEIAKLQRKGSFVDPTNKLLSTTYTLSPKEDDKERRSSLTIDTAPITRNSLSPTSPVSGSPAGTSFPYPSPPSPRKQAKLVYSDEIRTKQEVEKTLVTPNKTDKSEIFTFDTKETKPKATKSSITPKTTAELTTGELVTKIIQVERSPSRKLTQENKPIVEVRPSATVERTPSKKSLSESRPVVIQRPSTKQPKDDLQSKSPPVKPARSKSATRFGGKTSESEMSEDQSRLTSENTANIIKRKVVATPRRFIRNKSPRAKRSQSVTRVEDLTDKTGTGMSQTSREIIQLLQQARARSLSIPKDDARIPSEYKADKRRTLMTPNKSPATPRARGISCPKTIQLISKKEVLSGLNKKTDLDFDKSRSSGYIDASQSEYTSSCYSTSPSENEYDFNLIEKTAELNKKLSLLSLEMELRNGKDESHEETPIHTISQNVLRKRSSANVKKEHKKERHIVEPKPNLKEEKVYSKPSRFNILRKWRSFKYDYNKDYDSIKLLRNTCICDLMILIIFCGMGGMLFKNLEGSFESAYKCGTRNVKRDFIEHLWKGSHYLREEDWKSMARNKLHEFEDQLHTAHEAGVTSYSGQRSWNFMNSFVYCMTVVTTIGYGHIVPSTTYGRVATIFYAIVGIPLFLIVLADFGKLFTRIIKFFWAFIRRLYFTGSCKKVRKTAGMQEMMKGLNLMYDVVRRPSQMLFEEDLAAVQGDGDRANADDEVPPPKPPKPDGGETAPPPLPPKPSQQPTWVVGGPDIEVGTEPVTPAPSVFEIDDEFNLPISVAIVILIVYIFVGATVYKSWEEWSFFESFYFVFISMSTIGFGDFVPGHPMFMMASILYLVFGLALTSMCINVVQVKLSDTFRQASAKLGATIGLRVADEDGGLVPITPQLGDLAPVHRPNKSEDKVQTIKDADEKEN